MARETQSIDFSDEIEFRAKDGCDVWPRIIDAWKEFRSHDNSHAYRLFDVIRKIKPSEDVRLSILQNGVSIYSVELKASVPHTLNLPIFAVVHASFEFKVVPDVSFHLNGRSLGGYTSAFATRDADAKFLEAPPLGWLVEWEKGIVVGRNGRLFD